MANSSRPPGHQVAVAQVPAQGKGDLDYEPVPAWWPRVSLTALKLSGHDEQRPRGPSSAQALVCRASCSSNQRRLARPDRGPGASLATPPGTLVLSDVHTLTRTFSAGRAHRAAPRTPARTSTTAPPRTPGAPLPWPALSRPGYRSVQHLQVVRVHQGAEAPARRARSGSPRRRRSRVHGLQAPSRLTLACPGGRLECRRQRSAAGPGAPRQGGRRLGGLEPLAPVLQQPGQGRRQCQRQADRQYGPAQQDHYDQAAPEPAQRRITSMKFATSALSARRGLRFSPFPRFCAFRALFFRGWPGCFRGWPGCSEDSQPGRRRQVGQRLSTSEGKSSAYPLSRSRRRRGYPGTGPRCSCRGRRTGC